MTDKEKEHYENLARYYNSKKETCKTEMMKFKCVVEYEYPIEHKPPVKADIYLHGDKVSTEEITPIRTGLWIATNIENEKSDTYECSNCESLIQYAYFTKDCDYKYCPNCGAKMEIQE